MPATLFLTIVIAAGQWMLPADQIVATVFKGALMALDILLIIFGAILLLRLLESGGAIATIQRLLAKVSDDRRVQAVLIGYLFVCLIEAAAGFGTPGALAAPLLVSLGFPAMAAVVTTQIADSAATSFGAAGVPVVYGIGSFAADQVLPVTNYVALIHCILSPIVPLMVVLVLTRYYGKRKSWKEGMEAAPFAIFAGLAFGVPMLLAAWTLGPEIASIVGAIVSLPVVVIAARKGLFVPKTTWNFDDRKRWPAIWAGDHIVHKHSKFAGPLASFLPYLLVIALLLVTRLDDLPFKALLKSAAFTIGIGQDSYTFTLLYSPLAVFLVGCLTAVFLFGLRKEGIQCEVRAAFSRLKAPLVALVCAIGTVQLFISSTFNPVNLPSMPLALASVATALGKEIFIFASPFVGIFGSFIAGSNTVSNLLFGQFQLHAATQLGLSVAVILALQTVGGGAGNMIAVHNVIAASSATGLHHVEGHIIRKTLVPCLIYGLLAGIVGYILLALA